MTWWNSVVEGDMVRPIPLWNATSPDRKKLPPRVEVLYVFRGNVSQTGTMLEVQSIRGEVMRLDAGWFQP